MQPGLFMAAAITHRGRPSFVLPPGVTIRDGNLIADGSYVSGDARADGMIELCQLLVAAGVPEQYLQIWDCRGGRRVPAYFMSIADTAAAVLEPDPAAPWQYDGADPETDIQESLPL